MSTEQKEKTAGGLSIQTLLISAAAAVAAATIVPMFWQRGTLIATAMTPVIVALVSEGLRKPVQTVSAAAPKVTRRTGTGAAMRRFEPDAAHTRDHARVGARGRGPERFEPLPEHLREEAPSRRSDDPFGLSAPARRSRPRLKIALATGVLAFLAAAAVVTASELAIFGGSVSGERGRTSLFGGEKRSSGDAQEKDEEATPTATPGETPDAEASPTVSPTVTPQPETTPTPVPEATATPQAAPPAGTPAPVPTP
jgi:hypothetical protein